MNLDKRNIRTIPQCLGIRNSKILGIVLLTLFFSLDFFKEGQIIYATLPLFLTTLISIGISVVFKQPKREVLHLILG